MALSLHPRGLRYLAAVAHSGSIQAASRDVAISASAIDRQLLQLEEELGVPLFEREPRGVRLTAAGEAVLAMAGRWRSDLQRLQTEIKQLQGVHQGHVRLAAMDSHANGLLPGLIEAIGRDHPGIVLEVEIATPDEAVRRLTDGEAEVAIAFNVRPQRDLHIVWTTELPLGCMLARDHPLAGRSTLSLKDVAGLPMAVQSRALAIRRYLERRHAWLLAEARPPLVTNSLQLVKSVVCSGSYVAITSELDAAPEILSNAARFVPLDDPAAQPQSASVAVSARRTLPRIARVVAEVAAAWAQQYLEAARAANAAEKVKRRGRAAKG